MGVGTCYVLYNVLDAAKGLPYHIDWRDTVSHVGIFDPAL